MVRVKKACGLSGVVADSSIQGQHWESHCHLSHGAMRAFIPHVLHVTQEVHRLFVSPKPLSNRASESVFQMWAQSGFIPVPRSICCGHALCFPRSSRKEPHGFWRDQSTGCPDPYSQTFANPASTLWGLLAPAAWGDSSAPSWPPSAGVPHQGRQQSAGLGPSRRTEPGGSRC